MKILSVVKDGLKMGKDKAVSAIVGIGNFLKSRENRVITGIIFLGLGGALVVSGYIKIPQ